MTPINVHRQGRVEAIAYVDKCDAKAISKSRWWLTAKGYAINRAGRYMHRVIMMPGAGHVVDHLDHNPLMNVRSNLRVVTAGQNLKNQIRKRGIAGVSFVRRTQKWRASMMTDGARAFLGEFIDKRSAISARLAAVRSYWASQSLPVPDAIEQLYLNALAAA